MCLDCILDCLAFHQFATATRGDLNTALQLSAAAVKEPEQAVELASLGVELNATMLRAAAPTHGKILVAEIPIQDPTLLHMTDAMHCLARATQAALDGRGQDEPRAPVLRTLREYVTARPLLEAQQLVALVLLQYVNILSLSQKRDLLTGSGRSTTINHLGGTN